MSVVELFHDRLATTIILFFLVAGLWGLFEYARGGQLGGNIAGALIIGQVLVVIQGALGWCFSCGETGRRAGSLLYGFTAVLALPFVWSYVRDRAPTAGAFASTVSSPCSSSAWRFAE